MNSDECDKLVGQIRKDYLLIQKGKVWMILGGFIGVLAAAGLISYGSAKAVLASATAKQVEAELYEMKDMAEKQVEEIEAMLQPYQKQLDNLSSYDDKIRTMEDALKNRTVMTNKRYHITIPGNGELVARNGDYKNGNGIVFATSRKESWQFDPE